MKRPEGDKLIGRCWRLPWKKSGSRQSLPGMTHQDGVAPPRRGRAASMSDQSVLERGRRLRRNHNLVMLNIIILLNILVRLNMLSDCRYACVARKPTHPLPLRIGNFYLSNQFLPAKTYDSLFALDRLGRRCTIFVNSATAPSVQLIVRRNARCCSDIASEVHRLRMLLRSIDNTSSKALEPFAGKSPFRHSVLHRLLRHLRIDDTSSEGKHPTLKGSL